jgi:GT2 family glycosyltransferase
MDFRVSMNRLPRVSVVIPCYNARPYVGATLRSVHAQQGVELDVIVVDDGSSDGSPDLVERDFPGVRVVRQANQGVAVARNRGIAEARHDWVAFIDADDLWLPGKLRAQFERLAASPAGGCMAYTAWAVWSSNEPEPSPSWFADLARRAAEPGRWEGADGWIYPELLLDCEVWTSGVLAERALLRELGGFDPTLRIGEDYDLWLRASRVTPIVRVSRPLAIYRLHPASITRRVPAANHKGQIIERALHEWGYAGPDGRRARRADVARGLARSWADFAGAQLSAGCARAALPAALRSVRTWPGQTLGWTVLAKSAVGALAPTLALR